MLCRHCSNKKVSRPRGLCWRCFRTPGVKEKYVSGNPKAHRGVGNRAGESLPTAPTETPPKSPERLKVMMERAERGESVTHPRDKRLDLS